jgi:hypothetical protein
MAVGANSDWGRLLEATGCDRFDLEDLAHDDTEPHLDARTTRSHRPGATCQHLEPVLQFADNVPSGADVAAKACKYRISDGSSTRRGRWAIYRDELDAADAFLLGVYETDLGVLPQYLAIIPAAEVADLLGSWTDSPHHMYGQVARLPWSAVFQTADLPDPVAGGDA